MKIVHRIIKHPVYIYIYIYIYRVRRENFDTVHRKIDGIEMNIKVPYRLAIFAIIEILILEIVLRARREKRSSRLRCSPAQFIKHWLRAARWRGKRGGMPETEQQHSSHKR